MTKNIDLSDFFVTKKQANIFIQSLNNIIDKLFEVNFNLDTTLTNELGIDKKDKFINLLRESEINNSSNEVLKAFLIEIQENIRKLPTLTLTIAYEPNETSLKAFLDWFLISLKKHILLDIKIDYDLIAGATLNYKGKFKDYSANTLLSNLINQSLSSMNKTNENINVNHNRMIKNNIIAQ